ncbi:hypothetical protein [Marinilactibacillus sp. Marseille-P9653]|uniref:hypothetical protein n=1 Tax=Marinilactibacillus sp. Marseille-P9653 TaxID=2866583 RepID=UPI001CE457C3|nr:hypothetical protein [Marinilactibacillus sp. Marseille-P9653]
MTLMKRLLSASALTVLLVGCGTDEADETEQVEQSAQETEVETTTEDQATETEVEEDSDDEGSIEVDKGLFSTELTLPAELSETFEPDELALEEANITENEDGSVTIKMSRSQHQDLLDELKQTITDSVEELMADENFQSFKDIEFNNDFSEFSIIVDREAYEAGFDGFGIFGLAISALYYQVFEGKEPESLTSTFEIQDEATGEVFSTIVYPDDLEESLDLE